MKTQLYLESHTNGGQELLPQASKLWAANRLLIKGWQVVDGPLVNDPYSPYHGTRPAPRVLQNQLDQWLEQFIAETEKGLLRALQNHMQKRTASQLEVFSTILLLLMLAERDIWRLAFWTRHSSNVSNFLGPDAGN